jgi:tetratricopeptide (TPR) repeat protein
MVQKPLSLGACLIYIGILVTPAAAQTSHALSIDAGNPSQGTISADLLRYRLPSKALRMLQEARRAADAGDHTSAIQRLEETLAKYPASAAWAQSMLGVEYLKTYQLPAAVVSLEQAILLLPRDAVNRSNLGLALVLTGQYDRAGQELRRALELDGRNTKTKQLLNALLAARSGNEWARNPN